MVSATADTNRLHARPNDRAAIAHLLRRWLLLAILAGAFTVIFEQAGIDLFGYSQLTGPRTWFTLFFAFHLVTCLFAHGRDDEVLLLVLTPFLAQSYHVCLGWDAPAGALSVPRLLPYLVLVAAFLISTVRRRYRPSHGELTLSGTVLAVSVVAWLTGSEYTMVGLTVAFLLGALLPAFAMYIGSIAQHRPDLMIQFPAGVTLGMILLMTGFLAAFGLGTTIETLRGVGDIESAREVGDFNSLIPYLLLAWPFAVSYLRGRHALLIALLFVLFTVVTFAGVSKTMMVLAPPLMLLSLPAAIPRLRLRSVLLTIVVIIVLGFALVRLVQAVPAGMFVFDLWLGRLDIDRDALSALTLADVVQPVAVGSEAWDDRAVLRAEAMRIFFEHPLIGTGWATFPFLSLVPQGTSHALTTDLLQQTGLVGAFIFWCVTLEVLARLLGAVRAHHRDRRVALIFFVAFLLWLVAAHTVGAQLFMAANTGFTVNAITGLLYVMYLRRETVSAAILHSTVRP